MSITSRINEMSSHIEQAYDELQGLGADLTNVNKNIENISMVLDDIYDSMPQVSGEGTSLTLDDTRIGKIKSTLKGNTSQDGTPTPTTPIPVNVVSGDNEINVVGKNLFSEFSIADGTPSGLEIKRNSDNTLLIKGTSTAVVNNWINNLNISLNSGTYTFSTNYDLGGKVTIVLKDNNSQNLVQFNSGNSATFSINEATIFNQMLVQVASGVTIDNSFTFQLEKSSSASTYEPYQGNTCNINLPEGIELCKIGNHQDYFYKDSDKWYLHKETHKIVLNGTETGWAYDSTNKYFRCSNYNFGSYIPLILTSSNKATYQTYSNLFIVNKTWSGANSFRDNVNVQGEFYPAQNSGYKVMFRNLDYDDTNDLINWLINNNVYIYYPLETPTNIEVEYQPLIDQLNLLEKAMSKDGQTNISQVNNDLPFIISASALKEWQENTSLNSTLSMVNPLSLGNTLNTQENNTQPIEVDNIEPLEEEENEES